MDPSGTPVNALDHSNHRWASIMGTFIALLTLILPLFVIGYYSSQKDLDPLKESSYKTNENSVFII